MNRNVVTFFAALFALALTASVIAFAPLSPASLADQASPAAASCAPKYYPAIGSFYDRDIRKERAGPGSCYARHGDTLWRQSLPSGNVRYVVVAANDPQYVEWGERYAIMGSGALVDPHDARTIRPAELSEYSRMWRTFGHAGLASAVDPPMPDFNIVVAVTQSGMRYESLYVKCSKPSPWSSRDLPNGTARTGLGQTCEADWPMLPRMMEWDGLRFEPAKAKVVPR